MNAPLSNVAKDLISACKKGELNRVQNLLNKGLEIEDINHPDFKPLNMALKHGRWRIAKHLLEQQIIPDNTQIPPLIAATQYKKDTIQGLELIFSHTADLDVVDNNGRTALMTACLLGHDKKVKYLLKNPELLNAKDHAGMNALLDTIISQSHSILEMLLGYGIDVSHTNDNGDNALLIAVQQPNLNVRIIKTLLSNDVDPTVKNKAGKSAFSVAEKKHPKIFKLFIEKIESDKQIELPLFGEVIEAPIKQTTKSESNTEPSFHSDQVIDDQKNDHKVWFDAVSNGNLGIISQHLNKGVPIDTIDHRGCTALIHASGKGHRAVASYLIQNKANIEHRSDNGSTPLSSAIISNSRTVVGLLLKHGANANNSGPGGYPYLSLAASQWNEASVSMLLNADGDINTVDEMGMPLYHHVAIAAEYYGNTVKAKQTLRLLHQYGLDINTQNPQGNTALHILCGALKTKKYPADDSHLANIAHEMLRLGINPKIVNNDGFTAIQYAKKHSKLNTNGVILSYLDAW